MVQYTAPFPTPNGTVAQIRPGKEMRKRRCVRRRCVPKSSIEIRGWEPAPREIERRGTRRIISKNADRSPENGILAPGFGRRIPESLSQVSRDSSKVPYACLV